MLRLSPAAAQRHEWLTVYPLLSADDTALGYDLLAGAIAAGTLTISELGSATVPELEAVNLGDRDVLILDGEQFLGARQNRMASRSILLPAHAKTKIPVNCMEQGRWHERTTHFDVSTVHSPSTVRGHNRRREARRARAGQALSAAHLAESQADVWSEIRAVARDLESGSPTGALNEIAGRRVDDVRAWAASFKAVPGQVGLLAFLGSAPLGIDVIGDSTLYARLHDRLVGGYVQDALRLRGSSGAPDPEAAEAFLSAVGSATRVAAPTVGNGTYTVLTGTVTGGELEDAGRTAHLSAFPLREEFLETQSAPEGPRMAPPSHRRRIR